MVGAIDAIVMGVLAIVASLGLGVEIGVAVIVGVTAAAVWFLRSCGCWNPVGDREADPGAVNVPIA